MKYEVYGNLGCGYCELELDLLEDSEVYIQAINFDKLTKQEII